MTSTTPNRSALAQHAAMMAALARGFAAGDAVELIETHISSVLLAGLFAYKVKKPVDLGFVDFTTLERRCHFCAEEVRINRRTAPRLYLDVVPIVGTAAQPRFGAASDANAGSALDYAVRMVRFPDAALLDRRARAGQLTANEIDALALEIADFHAAAARADATTPYGMPDDVLRWPRDNFAQLSTLRDEDGQAGALGALIARLAEWTEREFLRIRDQLAQRRTRGFVRECHGDLHLRNIVLLDGVPTPFDAIEFNPRLRWIDVASDLAFLFMDLHDHAQPRFAWRLLDRYLQATGDFDALGVLRFYAVYRALVRAAVTHIRADQPGADAAGRSAANAACAHYLRLAEALAHTRPPLLVILFGVSASGKTTVAGLLGEHIGAIRVRSDIERKRLFGLAPTARPDDAATATLYAADATRRTYARLADVARGTIAAGYAVIVDAAFLRRDEREAFRDIARELGASFALIECNAPADVLRARIEQRSAQGSDASDATLAVLERQLATHEPVATDEMTHTQRVATDVPAAALDARCAAIAAALAVQARN